MERLHRIFSNGNRELKTFLDAEQIEHKYEESIVGKTVFLLISESHPKWRPLAKWLNAHDTLHTVELKFTPAEVRAAPWCTIMASHIGYPQPADDFGYLHVTYESPSGCLACGIGFRQVSPFRLRTAPDSHRLRLFQLNWVFDEFFVTDACRDELRASRISGIDFYPVLHHKTGSEIIGWSQMRIVETLEAPLNTAGLVTETCNRCSGSKFNYPQGEPLALASSPPETTPDVVKSREWFGSGGEAHHLVVVSQRFASLILRSKWRGPFLAPLVQPGLVLTLMR